MRRRATKQQIALTIGLLTVLVAAGSWWAPHIWWAFLIARNGAKISSVPVSTMHVPGQTSGWFACRVGALSFKLPPEMAEEAERSVAKERNTISLKSPSGELRFFVPFQVPGGAQTEKEKANTRMDRSRMQLIADAYRASTDDFRWTMSRSDLHRHQLLMNMAFAVYPHAAVTKVESLFDGPLEGLLMVHDRAHAMFEWRAKSEATAGYLGFTSTTGDLNLDHLRDICASVTWDEAKLGPEPTKRELAELVDAMEVTKE